MKALDEHGFPVPHAVDCNRHCVIMSRIQGYPLVQVKQFQNPDVVFETILGLIVRLAEHGLIHCDFNEFNIMVDDDEKVTMIDFPQMVSVSHRNAEMYFDRDIECIFKFFGKRFNLSFNGTGDANDDLEVDFDEDCWPQFSDIKKVSGFLDKELEASGFTRKDQDDIEKFIVVDSEKDSSSDSFGIDDEDAIKGTSERSLSNFESSCLIGQEGDLKLDCSRDTCKQNSQIGHESREDGLAEPESDSRTETQAGCDSGYEEEEENDSKNPELMKRLNKQRKYAIQSARGRRKVITSRNTCKDKGGKSSHNSKIQKQLSCW